MVEVGVFGGECTLHKEWGWGKCSVFDGGWDVAEGQGGLRGDWKGFQGA